MITKVNGYCVKMFTMENFGEWLLNAMKNCMHLFRGIFRS